jgi:hypothetical protein
MFSDYRFDILWLPLRLIYVFWLPIWYLVITTPFICFLITDLISCQDIKSVIRKHILSGVVITRYQIGNQKTLLNGVVITRYQIGNQKTWLPIWYLVITTPFNICFLIIDLISCDYHSVYMFSDYRFDILWLPLMFN